MLQLFLMKLFLHDSLLYIVNGEVRPSRCPADRDETTVISTNIAIIIAIGENKSL